MAPPDIRLAMFGHNTGCRGPGHGQPRPLISVLFVISLLLVLCLVPPVLCQQQQLMVFAPSPSPTTALSDEFADDSAFQFTQPLYNATIEENSGTAFSHIEAEVEEKIDALLEGHAFAEAVTDAVQGSLHGIVEEILDGILADAITDHLGDAEDIVRKGLRSIL